MRINRSDHRRWMKLNRQYKMKLMDWFTKSWVVANQHIGTDGQYDLFVAPQVSVEWKPLTSVWLKQIDRETDRGESRPGGRGTGVHPLGPRFQPAAKNFFEERILRKFWLKIDENRWFQATLTSKMEDPKKYQSTRMRSFIRFVIQKVGCRNFFVSKSKKN